MLNFYKFIIALYGGSETSIPPVIQPMDDPYSSIGTPDWTDASVFSPPVFSPPVFSPPVFSPPVFSPPVFSPPTFTPPTTTPPAPPVTTPVGTPPTLPPSPTAFTIAITWDPSVDSAPAGYTNDIVAAVEYLETQFTDPVTINIDVGYKEINGQPLAVDDLGESQAFYMPVTYASLRAAVATDARTAADASVLASLPPTSPVSGASYWVTTAQAKALGLIGPTGGGVDGYIGFAQASDFTFGDTATSGSVAAGTYDFFGTVVHELTEDMGRSLFVGQSFAGFSSSFTLMDLLHYSAPFQRDFTQITPGYFSVNSGLINQDAFNTVIGGDAGDWATSVADDPFDAFATPGVLEPVSANDLTVVDAIGWNPPGTTQTVLAGNPPSDQASQSTSNVSFSPETQFLASSQGRIGLSGGSSLVAIGESTAGDQFSYVLSGAGAGSFSLATEGNEEMLVAGPHGVQGGGSQGELYALTVTATDETATGNPSVADPINVVVGNHANDVIDLASMPGISTSSPSFIYGLGGNVTIDGTGMTGPLYFDGGAGADIMTGGSGGNVYEYGGANDSTASAMDIITNFNVAVDVIDLTGVISPISNVAALDPSATQMAGGSVGWQNSGGSTFVYVNTSGHPEALVAANMEIELRGSVALTAANFTHL